MKTQEKNRLINTMMMDKRLGAPHFRVLIFMMQKKEIRCKEIQEKFEMTIQQANKIIHDLRSYGYVYVYGKMESGRVLYYELNPDCYAPESEMRSKQLKLTVDS